MEEDKVEGYDVRYQSKTQNNQQVMGDSHMSGTSISSEAQLETGSGILHWFKNSCYVNNLVRISKTSVNFLITVLDRMASFLFKDNVPVTYVLANDKEFGAIADGFEDCACTKLELLKDLHIWDLPIQPVGFASGLAYVKRRVEIARQLEPELAEHPMITVAPVLIETSPQKWHCCSCVLLDDPKRELQLHLYTQSIPVPTQYVETIQSVTSQGYLEKYQGYAHSFREATENLSDWEKVVSGISRYTMLETASTALAGIYESKVDYI